MEIENGLTNISFSDHSSDEIVVPKPVAYRENITSNSPTFDAVLLQNEDLMNRLKVSLRRLSALENDNARLTAELNQVKLHNQSLGSHYAVYKEDVQGFKAELATKNNQIATLLEIKDAQDKKVAKLEGRIQEFELFQEKIQSEVKPYITELKTENITLKEEMTSYKNDIEKKESLVSQLRTQILDLTNSFKEQTQFLSRSLASANESFEEQLKLFHNSLDEKNHQIESLESQVIRLTKKTEHADALENELIAMKHQFESFKAEYTQRNSQLSQEFSQCKIQLDSVSHEKQSLEIKLNEAEQKLQNSLDQITNLRQIYAARTNEFEKIQKTNSALERLNVDLSQRLITQNSQEL